MGKSHLAIGLGIKAIERGFRVLFTTAATLIAILNRAVAENRLEDTLKLYTVPQLLIIDEIGYVPVDRNCARLFFRLVSRRCEQGPLILAANRRFGAWGDVLGNRAIAAAILDCVLCRAVTIEIRANSHWPGSLSD
jgi:DNA replication protein DnaC